MADPTLQDTDRQKLDGIVQKMVTNRESDETIRAVISDFKQKYARPKEGMGARLYQDAKLGFAQSAAHAENTGANLAHIVGATGIEKSLRDTAKSTAPPPSEFQQRDSLVDQIAQGVGSAVPSIIEYAPTMLTKKFKPLVAGAIGALGAGDKGGKEMLKGAIESASQFYLMGKAERLPTRTRRSIGAGISAALPAAVFSGADAKQTAAAALTGATFGAIPGKASEAKVRDPLKPETKIEAATRVLKTALNPRSLSTEADSTGRLLRKHMGYQARAGAVAETALREARSYFDGVPVNPDQPGGLPDEALHFIDAIQTGKHSTVEPELRPFTQSIRDGYDSRWNKLHDRGLLDAFVENYFTQIWNRADKALELYRVASKNPLPGSQRFTKQRVFGSIKQGLEYAKKHPELGMELASNNPIDLVLMGLREQDRLLMAHDFLTEMKKSGLVQYVPKGGDKPAGWVELEGPAAKLLKRAGGPHDGGEHYMPRDAAKLVSNHLSTGWRDNPFYNGAMGFANTLNKFQLGLSAFHLTMTTIEAAISQAALSTMYVAEGIAQRRPSLLGKGLASAGRIATVPFEPLVGKFRKTVSNKIVEEYASPGKHPEVSPMARILAEAGGRVDQDPLYKAAEPRTVKRAATGAKQVVEMAWDKRRDLFSIDPKQRMDLYGQLKRVSRITRIGAGVLGVPGAAMEKLTPWLFEYAVPMQKVGAFHRLMEFEIDKLGPKATQAEIENAAQRAWDSIDNRFGQLVYDNLFWQKTTKDLMMLMFRSVGWRLGTVREIAGGGSDWVKFTKAALAKKPKDFTPRMAYVMALPVITGILGGITNALLTHEFPHGLDYFHPRTGEKDEYGRPKRIEVASYINDVLKVMPLQGESEWGRLLKYVKGGVNPMLQMIADLVQNKDWKGTEIRGRDGDVMDQMKDLGEYFWGQFIPISLQSQKSQYKGEHDTANRDHMLSMVGVRPGPVDEEKPAYERYTDEHRQQVGPGQHTREQGQRQLLRSDMLKALRFKEEGEFNRLFELGKSKGYFKESDEQKLRESAGGSPGVAKYKGNNNLRLPDKLMAYKLAINDPAVTDDDKEMLRDDLLRSLANQLGRIQALPDDSREKKRVMDLSRILHLVDANGDLTNQ